MSNSSTSPKAPMRLKFKGGSVETAVPQRAPTGTKPPKPRPPTIGTESVVVKCGHTIAFDLYAKDAFRDQRRAKEVARDCAACRQARVQAEMAAAAERRAKKKQAEQEARSFKLRPRLPDGARFGAVYDAAEEKWTGTLTIGEATFERQASGLKKLLYKLDDAYRETTSSSSVS